MSEGGDEHQEECESEAVAVPQLAFVASASWEDVARNAVAGELVEARYDVSDALADVERRLRSGEELDEKLVRDARREMNQARRVLERHVATVVDETEPWAGPLPSIPIGRYREVAGVDVDDQEREREA